MRRLWFLFVLVGLGLSWASQALVAPPLVSHAVVAVVTNPHDNGPGDPGPF